MLIEMVKNKENEIKVIKVNFGEHHIHILSNCVVCYAPIKAGDTYIALCNKCGASMTSEQRYDAFQKAKAQFPGL